jgi:small GTP-binding protein
MSQTQENTIKIIILGSSGVGKTCILQRAFDNEYNQNAVSTIGIDFRTKFFKFDDTKIKVNYIDTAGQEKFRAISVNYLKGTDGAVLVYDVTQKKTFELIGTWLDDIRENNKMSIGKILIANKIDLELDREVTKEEGEQLAELLECKYFETSAKSGQNINESLDEIAKITYEQWKKTNENRNSIRISGASEGKVSIHEKKNCCGGSSSSQQ